jgi:hypothetical protein
MPQSRRETDDSWGFRGTVSAGALDGMITYASGVKEHVRLARRCGYWDK